MTDKQAKELVDKYLNGKCTPEEQAFIERFYLEETKKRDIPKRSIDFVKDKKEIFENVLKAIETPQPDKAIRIWRSVAVAASILIAISVSMYFYTSIKPDENPPQFNFERHDIPPGGNKAILTLADGRKVNLHDISKGEVIEQTGLNIKKADDGQLVYEVLPVTGFTEGSNGAGRFNTIETPTGGRYQISLPDGTMVWLNAESSLKYPTLFAADERKVELKGEAYFEVAENINKPFKVTSSHQEVEVLGTQFNINSYPDEGVIKTTLFEGAVNVLQLSSMTSKVLKPGQQSINTGTSLEVLSVDTEEALAWKNGYFMFNNEKVESIMRKVARWYDLDVVYQDNEVSNRVLSGTVSIFSDVSELFDVLKLTGLVDFKVEGRRVTVMK